MKNIVIIAESCICNEVGYMDLTAETEGNDFIVSTENHDGYEWKARCSTEHAFLKLVESIGIEKAEELLNRFYKK